LKKPQIGIQFIGKLSNELAAEQPIMNLSSYRIHTSSLLTTVIPAQKEFITV
jgi:hypothetical protein